MMSSLTIAGAPERSAGILSVAFEGRDMCRHRDYGRACLHGSRNVEIRWRWTLQHCLASLCAMRKPHMRLYSFKPSIPYVLPAVLSLYIHRFEKGSSRKDNLAKFIISLAMLTVLEIALSIRLTAHQITESLPYCSGIQ